MLGWCCQGFFRKVLMLAGLGFMVLICFHKSALASYPIYHGVRAPLPKYIVRTSSSMVSRSAVSREKSGLSASSRLKQYINTKGLETKPYKLVVSIADQRVYVVGKKGNDAKIIKTMICSTGTTRTPTPLGTFILPGDNSYNVGKWYYFVKYKVYAQYYRRIYRGYLFHSVLFNRRSESTLVKSSVNNLGRRASHGCIRLSVKDAKWMYEHIRGGTRVDITAQSIRRLIK